MSARDRCRQNIEKLECVDKPHREKSKGEDTIGWLIVYYIEKEN
jgi:hypothetical protein